MCEREREKRREGESKGDRVHERQEGELEHWEACREEELREGNYKGGL